MFVKNVVLTCAFMVQNTNRKLHRLGTAGTTINQEKVAITAFFTTLAVKEKEADIVISTDQRFIDL